MDNQKQQVAERVKEANNILVTVSSNPSVDQLAGCIGLTLALNKMGKHATAVFSGGVPSTIEFLQPEKTLESNTDSLRDFIIALDKSKADKLRYKVEDRVVKIFITPYKTSIGEKDLEFSQGDFNVDVVLALGVHNQQDLDQAITSHGRILHDATIVTINTKPGGELGGMNWLDAGASSLSELAAQLITVLDKKLIDSQIATAFLTGIVAETERFSNAKTSPQTMSTSADLMAAGANQQLVATKLEAPEPPPVPIASTDNQEGTPPSAANPDGTLEITHDDQSKPVEVAQELPEPEEPAAPQIHIDEHGDLRPVDKPADKFEPKPEPEIRHPERPYLEDPTQRRPSEGGGMLDGAMTSPMSANVTPGGFPGEDSPLGLPDVNMPLLDRAPLQSKRAASQELQGPTIIPPDNGTKDASEPTEVSEKPEPQLTPMPDTPEPSLTAPPAPESPVVPAQQFNPPAPESVTAPTVPAPTETLTQIEQDVNSPHLQQTAAPESPAPSLTFSPQPAAAAVPGMASPAPDPTIPPVPPTPQPGTDNAVPSSTDDARDLVNQAYSSASGSGTPPPIEALNAQPLGAPITQTPAPQPSTAFDPAAFGATDAQAVQGKPEEPITQSSNPNSPPPVPPPMLPPAYPS